MERADTGRRSLIRPYLPLNALRAFEAAARHASFKRAAIELSVTPAALSHQVKALEERIGAALFHRIPQGLALTDEGRSLLPVVRQAFDEIAGQLALTSNREARTVLSVGVVGSFATGWLLPRLAAFEAAFPGLDLRLSTNNNRVDIAEEGLDFAIRFGDGAWHGTAAELLFAAPLTPLCDPATAARLASPGDLGGETLLRSYRPDDWPDWFEAAGVEAPVSFGAMFDSSIAMVEAARRGHGVALAPARLFEAALASGEIVKPFSIEAGKGGYWLTWLKSRTPTPAMSEFRDWIIRAAAG